MNKKSILLLDTSTILHPLRLATDVSKGKKEYIATLLSYINSFKVNLGVDRVICVLDKKGSRYRKETFPEYKGHRKAKPMTPAEQEELNRMIGAADNLFLFEPYFQSKVIEGVEADDIISMLFHDIKLQEKFNIITCTVDKDFMSAIPRNKIYNHKKNRYFNSEDSYFLSSNRFLIQQALVGDSTDNIKGICGQKTALILVNNFKSFKEMRDFNGDVLSLGGITPHNKRYVVAALDKLKSDEGWEALKLSYDLVQIFKDTSKLNDSEKIQYTNIVQEILNWEPLKEFTISDVLDEYLWGNELAHLVEDLKYV